MVWTNYGALDVVIDEVTGRAIMARGGVVGTRHKSSGINRSPKALPSGTTEPKGKAGSNPASSPSYRSKTEARFAQYLDVLKLAGEIDGWSYEPTNFRLPGKKNFYKPDFCAWIEVTIMARAITFFDTKGRNKSDERSLVKIKTAAGLNRWARWVQVRWINGQWEERVIA